MDLPEIHGRQPEFLEGASKMDGTGSRYAGRYVMYARKKDAQVEQVEDRIQALSEEDERDLAGPACARCMPNATRRT